MIAGRYRHIAIEGPIGAGKTTLARRLAQHFNAHTLLEKPEANPFLERFYGDRRRYALATQLFFLFQRVQQLYTSADMPRRSEREHAAIVEAIARQDPDLAERAMRAHIESFRANITRQA